MRTTTILDQGLTVIRPLLGTGKSRLAAYLRHLDVSWSEDPSNASANFERVRVRTALEAMKGSGFALDANALSRTATRAARASDALDHLTADAWKARGTHAEYSSLGYATLDWAWLLTHPEELRLRMLTALTDVIGGQAGSVSLGQLEELTAGWALSSGATLHGTQWVPGPNGKLQIFRESARTAAPIDLLPGTTATWDRRFVLHADVAAPPGTIAALGSAGLAAIETRGWHRRKLLARALWTQPAFRKGPNVLAVPTLGYTDPALPVRLQSETLQPHFAGRWSSAENSALL